MKKKQGNPAINLKAIENRFYHELDISYDSIRDCERAGCDSLCRCERIVNERIDNIYPVSIANGIISTHCDPILRYCAERIITHKVIIIPR